ncbi:siderophore-interacting protein [Microbacterium oxydans]|uniref:siderophore-interacting protein n=1 Tax=Microbacterium oxydans TaxID=82380 RepID=UPI00226B1E86|nr:siderophore-interacting protein [Microbacterium oxydans]WAA67153.1 siderophore-interacting protein [Microbacterium oxydans]
MRTDVPLFRAEVAARTVVTPNMLRITLHGARTDRGERFVSSGRPDEFFGLWLTAVDGQEAKRYYSVRAWRPESDELDIDFVVHAHGPATQWARRALPGDRVAFDAPRGHFQPPQGTERVLLVGDATALPAIGRILEERSPADPPVCVIVSVDDVGDRQDLPIGEDDALHWVDGDEMLARTVSETATGADATYLWFSGEATVMRDVRRHLRHTLGWPTSRYMTMGYWRRDEERWAAEFTRRPDLDEQIAAIWENGEDDETQRDRIDELLTRNGL